MNEGKKFEEDFKKSVPGNVFFLRLKDGGGWSNAENTRFTPSNECDSIMYDGKTLYLLEFKSHKGKSLPFTCISEKQLISLHKATGYNGIKAGYLINFRDVQETYFIEACYVTAFVNSAERKSIPYEFVKSMGIKVPQEMKRTRYRYNIGTLLGVA
jgi:recombination protein U